MRKKLSRTPTKKRARKLAAAPRMATDYFEGGKVTRKFAKVADELLKRRAKAYRDLAK